MIVLREKCYLRLKQVVETLPILTNYAISLFLLTTDVVSPAIMNMFCVCVCEILFSTFLNNANSVLKYPFL